MKQFLTFVLALVFICGVFSGCSNTPSPNTDESSTKAETTKPVDDKDAFTKTAREVLDAVVAKAIELDTDKEYGIKSIACTDTPVDEDTCTDILGLSTEEFNAKVESAMESKPDGSWFTHSVVVIKVKDGADVASLAETIVKNTKPNRFGCLKPEAIVGGYAGQYIFFTASARSSCEAVFSAVQALSAITPVRIDRTNDWSGGGLLG